MPTTEFTKEIRNILLGAAQVIYLSYILKSVYFKFQNKNFKSLIIYNQNLKNQKFPSKNFLVYT